MPRGKQPISDELKKQIIVWYSTSPLNYRQIAVKVGTNKSTVGRIIKEYNESTIKPEPEKKKAKPKKSVIKIPELDEVVLFLQENKKQYPTLPKTFIKRVTGRDRWIIEQLIKIQRAILE